MSGEGRFQKLSKDYKDIKKKKAGNTSPNLRLTSDMMDSYKTKTYRDGIETGIFEEDEKQVKKSDNHNKFSGKSRNTNVPKRQFIPKKGQTYVGKMLEDIARIIKNNGERKDGEKIGTIKSIKSGLQDG